MNAKKTGPRGESCSVCAYMESITEIDNAQGFCHFRPPTAGIMVVPQKVQVNIGKQSNAVPYAIWPILNLAIDWCGAFERA